MNIIQRPTSKHGPGSSKPYYLVIHDTEGKWPSDLNWLLNEVNPAARVSVQYIIAPDGTVYQTVQDTGRAWHAGESTWAGLHYMNGYSIGIEISHISAGSAPYPPAQLRVLDELIWMLHQKHHFRGTRPIGHREIAPGRKSDPELNLENYTWAKVKARLGLQEEPDMTDAQDKLLKSISAKLDAMKKDIDKTRQASSYRESMLIAHALGNMDRFNELAAQALSLGVTTGFE